MFHYSPFIWLSSHCTCLPYTLTLHHPSQSQHPSSSPIPCVRCPCPVQAPIPQASQLFSQKILHSQFRLWYLKVSCHSTLSPPLRRRSSSGLDSCTQRLLGAYIPFSPATFTTLTSGCNPTQLYSYFATCWDPGNSHKTTQAQGDAICLSLIWSEHPLLAPTDPLHSRLLSIRENRLCTFASHSAPVCFPCRQAPYAHNSIKPRGQSSPSISFWLLAPLTEYNYAFPNTPPRGDTLPYLVPFHDFGAKLPWKIPVSKLEKHLQPMLIKMILCLSEYSNISISLKTGPRTTLR